MGVLENLQQLRVNGIEGFTRVSDWASWAIWDGPEQADELFFEKYTDKRMKVALSEKCIEKELNPKVVIIGLNVSSACSEWSNFHLTTDRIKLSGKVNNQNDRRLRYLFDKSTFRGAYMTDIFKFVEGSSSIITKRFPLGSSTSEKEKQYKLLKDEFMAMKVDEQSVLITLGEKVSDYLKDFIKVEMNDKKLENQIVQIGHCSLQNKASEANSELDFRYYKVNRDLLTKNTQIFEEYRQFKIHEPQNKKISEHLLVNAIGDIERKLQMFKGELNTLQQ